MVETALALPVVLFLVFVATDLARAAYTWVVVGQDAQAAARLAALPDNQSSDCKPIAGVITAGNGITIVADNNSYYATKPNPAGWTAASSLPANTGALYLYPAEAKAQPVAANCSNTIARESGPVTATVNFNFQPWTPIASQLIPSISIQAQATEETQY